MVFVLSVPSDDRRDITRPKPSASELATREKSESVSASRVQEAMSDSEAVGSLLAKSVMIVLDYL